MDSTGLDWRKASYSNGSGACVETASGNGVVLVRDTTDRAGERLAFTADAWRVFLAAVR
jgi:hypothetical protein